MAGQSLRANWWAQWAVREMSVGLQSGMPTILLMIAMTALIWALQIFASRSWTVGDTCLCFMSWLPNAAESGSEG
ncbi:MAG: hypothetical protein ACLUO4_04165 [Christensenellales bacterium]